MTKCHLNLRKYFSKKISEKRSKVLTQALKRLYYVMHMLENYMIFLGVGAVGCA